MTRKTYVAASTLLIVTGLFLLNYLGIFNWFNQNNGNTVDPEVAAGFVLLETTEPAGQAAGDILFDVDEQYDTEALPDTDDKNSGQHNAGESTTQSYPGTTFKHSVQVKHEGVVIKDKGPREGPDIQKRSIDDIMKND
jgi:hypothetical protein